MEIGIISYWGLKINETVKSHLNPEKELSKRGKMILCGIYVDGKLKGEVQWDGKHLSITEELVKPND